MFCPGCKTLLRPVDKVLKCPRCDFEKQIEKRVKTPEPQRSLEEDLSDVPVFSDLDTMPIDDNVICPKCQNRGAFWHMRQTRSADEATTRFYRCTECKHSWREYA